MMGATTGTEVVMDIVYETSELLRFSPIMRGLQAMSEEHGRAWVRYWKAKKFIG